MAQLQNLDILALMERLEAKLERQQLEMDLLREQAAEAKIQAVQATAQAAIADTERRIREEMAPKPPQDAVSDEQLSALQARLERLHAAKLLSDDEFFALEDLCADFAELTVGVLAPPAFETAATLQRLVAVSEKLASDTGLARQARRKFVS